MRAMECARSESTQALKQTNKFWGAYDLMFILDDIIFIYLIAPRTKIKFYLAQFFIIQKITQNGGKMPLLRHQSWRY